MNSKNLIENNKENEEYDGIIIQSNNEYVGECKECHKIETGETEEKVGNVLLHHFRIIHDSKADSFIFINGKKCKYIQFHEKAL